MIDREHDKLCNHYKKDFSHTCYIYVSALNILSKTLSITRYMKSTKTDKVKESSRLFSD